MVERRLTVKEEPGVETTAARTVARPAWVAGRRVHVRASVAGAGPGPLSGRWIAMAVWATAAAIVLGLPEVPVLPGLSALAALVVSTAGALSGGRWRRTLTIGSFTTAALSLVDTAVRLDPASPDWAPWILVEGGFLLFLLVQIARRLSFPWGWPVGGAMFMAISVIPVRIVPPTRASPPFLVEIAGFCCGTAFLAGCAVAVGFYLRWLDDSAGRAVRWARHEQRRQLERDVHDWLAHEVTAIVLEAQAAQLSEGGDGEMGLALRRIEEAGVRALESMDRAIRLLRLEDGLVGEADEGCLRRFRELPELVTRFDRVGSTRAELLMEEGMELAPEIEDAGYRVVLESLTNVRRHAATATQVRVAVRQEGGSVVLTVADDGRPERAAQLFARRRNGGAGLVNLAERVHALGGSFAAGPGATGGWRVQAVLPLDGR